MPPSAPGPTDPARWLPPAAWLVFAFSLLLQIPTWRSFFGDGAAFFVEGLRRGEAVIWPAHRYVTSLLYSLPFWAGLKLGITDVELLQALFALGLLAPWPLALWLCWRLAPGQLWLPVTACAVGYLNTSLLAFSSALAAHALVWPLLIALLFVRPLDRLARAVTLLFSLLLVWSYESQLILGPVLALLAFHRLAGPERPTAKVVLALAGLLLLASAGVALEGMDDAGVRANRAGYLSSAAKLLWQPPWTVAFCALAILAALALLRRPRLAEALAGRRWPLALLLALVLVWGLWPLLAPGLFRPVDQYHARALNLAVPLALLPVGLLVRRHADWFAARRGLLGGAAATLLLAQSLWHLSATAQWQGYTATLRTYLATQSGPLRLDTTPLDRRLLGRQTLRYTISWTLPYVSLLLAPDGQVRSLLWTPSPFQPLDPRDPARLPDLSRYGYDFTLYRQALEPQVPGNP